MRFPVDLEALLPSSAELGEELQFADLFRAQGRVWAAVHVCYLQHPVVWTALRASNFSSPTFVCTSSVGKPDKTRRSSRLGLPPLRGSSGPADINYRASEMILRPTDLKKSSADRALARSPLANKPTRHSVVAARYVTDVFTMLELAASRSPCANSAKMSSLTHERSPRGRALTSSKIHISPAAPSGDLDVVPAEAENGVPSGWGEGHLRRRALVFSSNTGSPSSSSSCSWMRGAAGGALDLPPRARHGSKRSVARWFLR